MSNDEKVVFQGGPERQLEQKADPQPRVGATPPAQRPADTGPDEILANLSPGETVRLTSIQPSGSLMARKSRNGTISFHWRATFRGQLMREPIGIYSPTANRTWSKPAEDGRYCVRAASAKAVETALAHDKAKDVGGLNGQREIELRAESEAEAHREAERRTLEDAARSLADLTFAKLLELYWRALERKKAASWKEVRNAIVRNIIKSSDSEILALASKPAVEIRKDDIVRVLSPIYGASNGRQANKIRAYISAAFQTAIEAAGNADASEDLRRFQLESNPVLATAKNQQYNASDKNPLNLAEMRTYWKKIKDLPGLRGRALRIHLLLGAPRIQQLVRVTKQSVTIDGIVLVDIKGRRARPRPYELPLLEALDSEIQALSNKDGFLLSTDGGKTALANTTLSQWARDAVAGEISGFSLKRTRSGVETLLASMKISRDVRGKLQSHGQGGVQDEHYDGHEYYDEKFEALDSLYRALTTEVELTRRRRRKAE